MTSKAFDFHHINMFSNWIRSVFGNRLDFLLFDNLFDVPDSSIDSWSNFDDSGVTSARNTVVVLDVRFGKIHFRVQKHLLNIFLGGAFDNISNIKFLDSFVLSYLSATVGANYISCVSSILFSSTIISSFLWHL